MTPTEKDLSIAASAPATGQMADKSPDIIGDWPALAFAVHNRARKATVAMDRAMQGCTDPQRLTMIGIAAQMVADLQLLIDRPDAMAQLHRMAA